MSTGFPVDILFFTINCRLCKNPGWVLAEVRGVNGEYVQIKL